MWQEDPYSCKRLVHVRQLIIGREGISKIGATNRLMDWKAPKEATVAHLATLIADQRLIVGWRLGLDLASLGFGVSTVLANDLSTDPVVRAFFQDLVQDGNVAKDATDFLMSKPELHSPITLGCAILTGNQVNLR